MAMTSCAKQALSIKPASKEDANLSAKQFLFSLYLPISDAERPNRIAQKRTFLPRGDFIHAWWTPNRAKKLTNSESQFIHEKTCIARAKVTTLSIGRYQRTATWRTSCRWKIADLIHASSATRYFEDPAVSRLTATERHFSHTSVKKRSKIL